MQRRSRFKDLPNWNQVFTGGIGKEAEAENNRALQKLVREETGSHMIIPHTNWNWRWDKLKMSDRNDHVFQFSFLLQVGGWTQVYGDILSFATIRGGSHTAPISQPARSLALFTAFLEGKPLPDAWNSSISWLNK